jgi:hypothetical protein
MFLKVSRKTKIKVEDPCEDAEKTIASVHIDNEEGIHLRT